MKEFNKEKLNGWKEVIVKDIVSAGVIDFLLLDKRDNDVNLISTTELIRFIGNNTIKPNLFLFKPVLLPEEKVTVPEPKFVHHRDMEPLEKLVIKYVEYHANPKYDADMTYDMEHRITEAAVEAIYGDKIYDWINEQTDLIED